VKLSKSFYLFIISSDSKNADRFKFAEKCRKLKYIIRSIRFRDAFLIHDTPDYRVRNITRALDNYNPNIIYFSSHENRKEIFFKNDTRKIQVVNKNALTDLLDGQKNIKLIILNIYYFRNQTQYITNAVGHVIIMEGAI
jgi:hypothetical protein